ncbi:hypothetical protein ES705_43737 [subsurface metagenome]
MISADVISTLEDLAENPEQDLGVNQVHALLFAVALIRALPEQTVNLVDVILNLSFPTESA